MARTATIRIENENFPCPVIEGTEEEYAVDARTLRSRSGYITFDDGYGNTGSCTSEITFIDGEKGILRYRGYPIEQLAARSSFLESSYLIIYGELPTQAQLDRFSKKIHAEAGLHVDMEKIMANVPDGSHPMAILSALTNVLGCYHPHLASNNRAQDVEHFDEAAAILLSKIRTIAAMALRVQRGLPVNHPRPDLGFCGNFLHLMFSEPFRDYEVDRDVADALNLFLLLHADHEQNCSTSTVRMVASGGANLFASVSSGINALWGPLHGGANMAVIQMLEAIRESGDDGSRCVAEVKDGKRRLMGFGHRVYKNYDPRAKILGSAADRVLRTLGEEDELLNIARRLEKAARKDSYFVERRLYPNVDFYSGIILRAVGVPLNMFTVMFAIGRCAGWIAHWRELAGNPTSRIHRPRQIYCGPKQRDYLPIGRRR